MLRFLARLSARFVFVVASVVTLVFFVQRLIPGTPADAIFGPDAPAVQKQIWLHERGFDRPLQQQYKDYVTHLLRGDFGRKLIDDKEIGPQLRERLKATFQLGICAFAFSMLFAFVSGILAALREGSVIDHSLSLLSVLLVSSPVFMTGTILLWLFAVQWNLLPLTGQQGFKSLLLPALTLGAALAAMTSRMIRATLLEVLHENYIRTARAKGLRNIHVYLKHALRNAILPVIAILGLQLAGLLGGAVITEQVFTWPGLGSLMIEAVNQRDYNLVSACVVVLAVVHVTVSSAVELLQKLIDPRTPDVAG
jgi:peptide/nickel transport system permease protein